jgi:rod shape-determining protein MreC
MGSPLGGADRYGSRADTLVFLGCVALSLVAMGLPATLREPFTRVLRQTILAPLLTLQQQSELLRTSRTRFERVEGQRDSAMLAATFLPELRNENTRLRALLGLGTRLGSGYVAAEVLHQAEPTSELTLIVSAGRQQGVKPFAPVVSAEGLVGMVSAADAHTSTVVTWSHPEFRASAMGADASVFGIVQPGGAESPGVWLLELRGVPYRQTVAPGTLIVTSGLGGVFPRGIPIGSVSAETAEASAWERRYVVRPAVHPASVSHVMILVSARDDLRGTFTVPAAPVDSPAVAPRDSTR